MESRLKINSLLFMSMVIGGYSIFLLLVNIDNLTHKVFSYVDIPTPYNDVIIGLVFYLVLTFLILLTKNKDYLILWNIKAFITLIFMIVYEYLYWLDAYGYYSVALVGTSPFNMDGTHNMKYLNYLFTYLVGNSYYSLKLLNSFIGFLSLILFYKTYVHIMIKSHLKVERSFMYILFLLPSILFWSSIMGKDPINLFFTAIFTYTFVHLLDYIKIRYLLVIVFAIIFVALIRSWWTIIYLFTIFFYSFKITDFKQVFLAMLIAPIGYVVLISFLHKFGVDSIDTIFLAMSTVSKNMSYGGSSTVVVEIKSLSDYILYFVPNFITAVFRPLPFDARNPFTALAAIENTIMIYLFYKYIIKNFFLIIANKYMKFFMSFIFSWSLFYVILSPGNLGMAVRFKLQILPAMLILIFISRSIILARDKKVLSSK